MSNNSKLAKKVINTETGVIYRSARNASECENINKNTLYSYLNNDRLNLTSLRWYTMTNS